MLRVYDFKKNNGQIEDYNFLPLLKYMFLNVAFEKFIWGLTPVISH